MCPHCALTNAVGRYQIDNLVSDEYLFTVVDVDDRYLVAWPATLHSSMA